jgi:hypothetical protein
MAEYDSVDRQIQSEKVRLKQRLQASGKIISAKTRHHSLT